MCVFDVVCVAGVTAAEVVVVAALTIDVVAADVTAAMLGLPMGSRAAAASELPQRAHIPRLPRRWCGPPPRAQSGQRPLLLLLFLGDANVS